MALSWLGLRCSSGVDAWIVKLTTLALIVARAVVRAPVIYMTTLRLGWAGHHQDSTVSYLVGAVVWAEISFCSSLIPPS